MTKILDSTNIGYLISKIKSSFWQKTDTTQLEIDLEPTINSRNLVTSNGVYSKIHNLNLEFDPSNSALLFKSGTTIISTVDVSDFSITGILSSASLNNDVLTLNFSSGEQISLNIANILSDVLTEYNDKIDTLQNRHVALSETAYELLAEKDPDTFYYIYEE